MAIAKASAAMHHCLPSQSLKRSDASNLYLYWNQSLRRRTGGVESGHPLPSFLLALPALPLDNNNNTVHPMLRIIHQPYPSPRHLPSLHHAPSSTCLTLLPCCSHPASSILLTHLSSAAAAGAAMGQSSNMMQPHHRL